MNIQWQLLKEEAQLVIVWIFNGNSSKRKHSWLSYEYSMATPQRGSTVGYRM